MSINVVCIAGNLTRDPEMKQTASGTQVLSFCVAVNDRRKNPQTGEWEDVPNYVDCDVFGSRADALSRYLAKGSKVAVSGRLHYHSWTAKDGSKRSKLDVIANDVEFLSAGGKGRASGQQAQQQRAPMQADDAYDENIPF